MSVSTYNRMKLCSLNYWLFLLVLGVFFSVVWYPNFEAVQISNSQDMTFMKIFWDQNLYPSSFLLRQLYPIHLSSLYYWIIGLLGTFVDPYWGLYGCFILTNCLVIAGLFHLARTITRDLTASFLSVLALSLQWQLGHALGGSGPLGLAPAALHIATGISLFSISFFLQRRSKTSFILAGIAFNFHASLAIFVLTMFGVTLLIRKQLKELGIGCLIAAVAASPMFIYLLSHAFSAMNATSFEHWYQIVRLRSAHHTMPFLFKFHYFIRFIPYIFVFLLGYRMSQREAKDDESLYKLNGLVFLTLGIIILCGLGTVFTEWFPVVSVIELTPFRSTRFFVVFAVILYLSSAIRYIGHKNIEAFAHTFLIAGILAASFPAIYGALIGLILISTHKRRPFLAIVVTVVLTIGVLGALYYSLQLYGIQVIIQRSNLPMFFALLGLLMVYGAMIGLKSFEMLLKPTFLVLGALMIFLAPVYPLFFNQGYFTATKDLQLWLKNNTPAGRLVVLPPEAGIWNGLSERGDTFSFTEIAYQIYVPSLSEEIMKRTKDYVDDPLGFKDGRELEKAMTDSYNSWNEAKFRAIGAKYESDYAVVGRNKDLQFPLLYENNEFRVYDIQ